MIDLIQLFPFAMTVSSDGERPLLLLKDKSHELTLPVPLNQVEAGVTITQSNRMVAPNSPHRATEVLLKSMGVKILKCVFTESQDNRSKQMWTELELDNHPLKQKNLYIRADECMSLCLHLEVPLFASKDYILKSKIYRGELSSTQENMKINPRILEKTHPFVM